MPSHSLSALQPMIRLYKVISENGKEREVEIRRQMGHLPEGSVLKAYDGSELLDERYNFLVNWGDLLLKNGLEI